MKLYEQWLKNAYDQTGKANNAFWNSYMPREQAIYEDILGEKKDSFTGTVSKLGELYKLEDYEVTGFLDGISGGLKEPVDVEAIEDGSYEVSLQIDFEALYKKMVEYKAKHLYELPQWDNIFTSAQREEFFSEQKKSGTVVKGEKVGRNDPCPCGSGKKYKKCCGA